MKVNYMERCNLKKDEIENLYLIGWRIVATNTIATTDYHGNIVKNDVQFHLIKEVG